VSLIVQEPDSRHEIPTAEPDSVAGDPLAHLPVLSRRQMRLEERLRRGLAAGGEPAPGVGFGDLLGAPITAGGFDVRWRASGLARPGFIVQIAWPRLACRFALGIETPLAHALVDRLLGFERLDTESRRQLTPVEWGILTFVAARGLRQLAGATGPFGPWDLTLDRAGPDPFDVHGLGAIVTIRWPIHLGSVSGSVRLWVPESLVSRWTAAELPEVPEPGAAIRERAGELTGLWRAEVGTVAMPKGLGKLRVGSVLPPGGVRLSGTPADPRGAIDLVLDTARDGRYRLPAEPVSHSGGGRLRVTAPFERIPTPREALAVNPASDTASPANAQAVPVTLVVELGRVNLPLRRLADLKPGDVIELGRHSREPVELTSGGRLVARGELVQIDTELGVRVTSVFL
jgi:type III secretion system YscQ/HrcQ family protein